MTTPQYDEPSLLDAEAEYQIRSSAAAPGRRGRTRRPAQHGQRTQPWSDSLPTPKTSPKTTAPRIARERHLEGVEQAVDEERPDVVGGDERLPHVVLELTRRRTSRSHREGEQRDEDRARRRRCRCRCRATVARARGVEEDAGAHRGHPPAALEAVGDERERSRPGSRCSRPRSTMKMPMRSVGVVVGEAPHPRGRLEDAEDGRDGGVLEQRDLHAGQRRHRGAERLRQHHLGHHAAER